MVKMNLTQKHTKHAITFIILFGFLPFFTVNGNSYDTVNPKSDSIGHYIRLFVDCGSCDFTYLRKEVNFVNFVRDKESADVHLLVTASGTGSGGAEYHLSFIGLKGFAGKSFELAFVQKRTDTYDEFRKGITSVIKMGLMPFVSQTELGKTISIDAGEMSAKKDSSNQELDKWNYWVFGVSLNGSFQKEESQNSYSVASGISGSRVTEKWKMRFDVSKSIRENTYTDGDEVITSSFKDQAFSSNVIRSLTPHWSGGLFFSSNSSTYTNTKYSVGSSTGVEYNFFNWKESDKRQLTVAYTTGLRHTQYNDTTIYNNIRNDFFSQTLRTSLSMTQPWGGVYAQLAGTNYWNKPDKYSISFHSSLSLRITKGLSVYFSNSIKSIHDQFYLPRGEASREEILLQQRKVATAYEISFYSGISYSFGSMYNNIVNERF